jgi:hypothetical protein
VLEALHRFIAALREAGVRVSPAESIDAARAVREMGIGRRGTVRAALRATLAKTRHDVGVFDRIFEAHFRPARAPREPARGKGGPGEGAGPGRRRPPSPESPPSRQPRAGRRIPALEEPPPRAASRPGRLRLLLAPPRALRDERARRVEGAPAARPPAPQPRRRHAPPPARRRPAPPDAARAARGPANPRRVDLRLPPESAADEALAREAARLIREIRLKAGRRARRSRRGRLWPARVMRASLATGGVPFLLPRRVPRPRRPRVLVLVDVSWSVQRASAFFLLMARAFLARGSRARVWLFVDRCVEATARLALRRDRGVEGWGAFLRGIPDLDPDAPSDYGRAFWQAAHAGPRRVGASPADALLVVLGDARSNFRDPQAWAFEDLASRCRRVIWLDPEPAELWGTGDSALADYLPCCDVVCEARDLEGIARGVAEIARSL